MTHANRPPSYGPHRRTLYRRAKLRLYAALKPCERTLFFRILRRPIFAMAICWLLLAAPTATAVTGPSGEQLASGESGFVIDVDDDAMVGFGVSGGGDVNGDGVPDVAFGSVKGEAPGYVYVVFGGTEYAELEVHTIGANGQGFAIQGEPATDWFGISVTVEGDYNADGLADIVVGAPYAEVDGSTLAGVTYVVFGKSDSDTVLASDIARGIGGFALNGTNAGAELGYSVDLAGDVNGDGMDDLVVGSAGAWIVQDDGSVERSGKVYVIFGGPGVASTTLADVENGIGGFVIHSEVCCDFMEVSGAGDVNGDGLDDIVYGADSATRAYVVFGSTEPNTVEFTDLQHGIGGFVIDKPASGRDMAGAGDVNGDGLDDVFIAGFDSETNARTGNVIFGKTDTNPVDLADIANGIGGFTIFAQDAVNTTGILASDGGDFNGDGLDDVLLSVAHADEQTGDPERFAYLVFGKTDTAPVFLDELNTSAQGVVFAVDAWGVSSAADINNDGFGDIHLGSVKDSRTLVVYGRDATGNSSSDTCFIATAAYGTPLAGDIDVLRAARDTYLLPHAFGAAFVDTYYRLSPPVANRVAQSATLAAIVRGVLRPVILLAQAFLAAPGLVPVLIGGAGIALVALLRRKKPRRATARTTSAAAICALLFAAPAARAQWTPTLDDLRAGRGGFVISTADEWTTFGISVGGDGDVNGDGFPDLIVGGTGIDADSGIHVILGDPTGVPVDADTLQQSGRGFVIHPESLAWGGSMDVTIAGDVNGDDLDDMILSMPYADVDEMFEAGEVYVIFGDRNPRDVFLTDVAKGEGGFALYGSTSYAWFGTSANGAGDVNGDGLDDVVISGPNVGLIPDARFSFETARIYVIFGHRTPTGIDLSDLEQGTGGFVIDGRYWSSPDNYRSVGAAGDLNADGLGDIIVGNPIDDPWGKAYVVFGKTDTTPVTLEDIATGSGGGFVINGPSDGSQAGFSVSRAGDVNGDGIDDVVIGDPNFRPDYHPARCYVVFGKVGIDPVDLDAVIEGQGGFVVYNEHTGQLGASVSYAGDVNADGFDDVLLGAPYGWDFGGKVFVVYGKPDTEPVVLADLPDTNAGIKYQLVGGEYYEYGSTMGWAIASAGDVNRDGRPDFHFGNRLGKITYVIFAPNDSNSGSDTCFIATAAYGTPLAGDIDVLRAARDTYLLPHAFGAAFVDTYYRLSPPIARRVAASPRLAETVRLGLVPLIALLRNGPAAIGLALGFLALFGLAALRRNARNLNPAQGRGTPRAGSV